METPETILKTWMRRVWNELDHAAIDEMLAPDALVHGVSDVPLRGPDGWRQFYGQFVEAFGGFRFEIVDQVVSGDKVAGRFVGSMTHKGTGKAVTVDGMIICRVSDGKVVEGWNTVNFLPMLTSLGTVRPDAINRALAL